MIGGAVELEGTLKGYGISCRTSETLLQGGLWIGTPIITGTTDREILDGPAAESRQIIGVGIRGQYISRIGLICYLSGQKWDCNVYATYYMSRPQHGT